MPGAGCWLDNPSSAERADRYTWVLRFENEAPSLQRAANLLSGNLTYSHSSEVESPSGRTSPFAGNGKAVL